MVSTEGWHVKNSLRDTYGTRFVRPGLIYMALVLYIVVWSLLCSYPGIMKRTSTVEMPDRD